MALEEDVAQIREDVAYIKAKIEVIPDFEQRIRVLERVHHSLPSIASVGVVVAFIGVATTVANFVLH